MKYVDVLTLQTRIETVLPTLNEYQRRRYLAAEAKTIGHGGIVLVSRLSGITCPTIIRGIKELNNPNTTPPQNGHTRKIGGGRKNIYDTQPNILQALKELVDYRPEDDHTHLLLWTNKSLRNLEKDLKEQGYNVCYRVVGIMLKKLGYGLHADKKLVNMTHPNPDLDGQLEYINCETTKAFEEGNPVLFINVKKNEKLENFKNNDLTYQKFKSPIEMLRQDFPLEELGKATPFEVYDIFKDKGFVNGELIEEIAVFAVESIRRWWYTEGFLDYAGTQKIVLSIDCGDSNRYRSFLWQFELQKFANEIGRSVRVLHFPPKTSKWTKMEQRLFSFVNKNWHDISLISVAFVVSLIGTTKTQNKLPMHCVLDEATCKTDHKVSSNEVWSISILPDDFHGEWNYTITPNNKQL